MHVHDLVRVVARRWDLPGRRHAQPAEQLPLRRPGMPMLHDAGFPSDDRGVPEQPARQGSAAAVTELSEAWAAWVDRRDPVAHDFLVRTYLGLAGALARKAIKKAPPHQDRDDIISFARQGLLDA